MSQILAVDYGSKRVGLAVSDEARTYALPLQTLTVPARARAAAVAEVAMERGITKVVIGRPVRTQGEDSQLWPEIEKFGERLSTRGLDVIFEDEAFTTTEARELLSESGVSAGTGDIDAMAAKLILEQYLKRLHEEK